MKYRNIGPDIEASVVGLGAWAIGGWMWGGTDEGQSIRAIHASLDSGVNLVDTAPIYGFGRSEEIVGRAIAGRRDKVILATKCTMVCNPTVGKFKTFSDVSGPNEHGHIAIHIYAGANSIKQEVEASLKRLQTDYIDLLQTHWQDATTPIAETMGAMLELKQAGKIRAIGACNATGAQLAEYRKHGQLDSDQEKFSMIDRTIEPDQLPYCLSNQIALLAYSPMERGLLTGKIGPARTFASGDARLHSPKFSVDHRENVAKMLASFEPIAKRHDISLAQLTIAWTVSHAGVSHALCGARNEQQAMENAAAGDVELSSDELMAMDRAIEVYFGLV